MNNFWFVRGVSGAGKSTVASLLSTMEDAVHVEADMFRMVDGKYVHDVDKNHYVHQSCFDTAKEQMALERKNVIVANTSTRKRDVKKYKELCESMGYRFISIIVENYHSTGDTHNVPQDHKDKMERQLRESMKFQ